MWLQKSGSKYHSLKTEYGGYIYASKKEAAYAQELDLRVKAKDIKSWERQFKVSIDINGFHICNYYVDFLIHHKDKSKELVEIKGFQTDVFRMKRKLLEAVYLKEHPDVSYTMIL